MDMLEQEGTSQNLHAKTRQKIEKHQLFFAEDVTETLLFRRLKKATWLSQ